MPFIESLKVKSSYVHFNKFENKSSKKHFFNKIENIILYLSTNNFEDKTKMPL